MVFVIRFTRRALRRWSGWCWLAGWLLVLRALTAPWGDLGGVVAERTLWSVKLVPWAALPLGWWVGLAVRDAAQRGSATHRSALRWRVQPVVWATGTGVLWLWVTGRNEPIGIPVLALASYWAGFDLAIGIWPLMLGDHHRFASPIPPDWTVDPDAFDAGDSNPHQTGDLERRAGDR